ncbi:Methenyl tetrahydrofolate cyclohydrolase [Butyrivibrio fibrisolvens 16/4]|nr:Methenyl tetrahydrofolate cyclohydrolase [Butyrivibrio fibrisolvens 16/4]
MDEAEKLREALLQCIEDDATAFEPLSKAYSLPKDAEGRDEIMEKCLRDAASVPFKILKLACIAVDLQRDFADKGSTLMISDAATGVAMLEGAIKGAAVNVRINTKSMKDREYAENLDRQVDEMVEEYTTKAKAIYDDVWNRL